MDKAELRQRIWDDLEESGEARFPYPPHGRIPNFSGADDASERLTTTKAWRDADVIKVNPDAPQLPVRRAALRVGKLLYMAVPRLRDEKCFLRLDPGEIDNIDDATTISGSAEYGVPVKPNEMAAVDMIVSGSVAVNSSGARVGKGEGYSDLEFAILREYGLVDNDTFVVTTIHERQLVDDDIPTTPLDVPLDRVVTSRRVIHTDPSQEKPDGVDWDALPDDRSEEIPILNQLRPQ